MTDEFDHMFAEDSDDARDEIKRLIRGRGIRVAVQAAIQVCQDPKAPAPAKATAAGLLLRAAGLLDAKQDEETLEPHEMSASELAAARRRAEAQLEAIMRGLKEPEPDPRPTRRSRGQKLPADGIFG